MNFAGALNHFGAQLGIGPTQLQKGETIDRFFYRGKISPDKLKKSQLWTDLEVEKTFSPLAARGLAIEFGEGEFPALSLSTSGWEFDEDVLAHEIEMGTELRFEVVLDKTKLLATYEQSTGDCFTRLFIWEHRLCHFLERGFEVIDDEFFSASARRSLVVVLDQDDYLVSGPYFVCCSTDRLEDATRCAPQASDVNIDVFQHPFLRFNWSGFTLQKLTPLHMRAMRLRGVPTDVDGILDVLTTEIWLLFSANKVYKTKPDKDEALPRYLAEFTGPHRTTTVELGTARSMECDTKLDDIETAFLDLWPKKPGDKSHLKFFRNVVSRAVHGKNATDNCRVLKRRLFEFLTDAEWHFELFINDSIDQHFDAYTRVQSFAQNATQDLDASIQRLVNSVSESAVKAVGVVILAIVGLLLKGDSEKGDLLVNTVRCGILSYAAYLFLFEFLYRGAAAQWAYRDLAAEAVRQKVEFETILGKKKVGQVYKGWDSAQARFHNFSFLSGALLVFTVIALVVFAIFML